MHACSAAILLVCAISRIHCLTRRDVQAMKTSIRNAMTNWVENGRQVLVPGAVRLAFHDCVGGCNGCVDTRNSDNRGLARYMQRLEPVYQNYSIITSRADFWALAAITALDMAGEVALRAQCGANVFGCGAAQHNVVFRYGRRDCGAQGEIANTFPNGRLALDHTLGYFDTKFHFNQQETVALLGVHTLGELRRANSDFSTNRWTINADRLDNTFYRDLTNPTMGWFQTNRDGGGRGRGRRETNREKRQNGGRGGKGKNKGGGRNGGFGQGQGGGGGGGGGRPFWWETSRNRVGFMLNTDMSLYKQMQVNSQNGRATCSYNGCPTAPTAALVESYARNNTKWLADFSAVFQKMVEFGSSDLRVPD